MFRLNAMLLLAIALGSISNLLFAQDAVPAPTLSISYFLLANKVPYLEVAVRRKIGRKFQAVKEIPVRVYFGEATAKNLLGYVVTDTIGKARVGLPPSFKNTWDSLNEFKFVATAQLPAGQDSLSADVTVKKAILTVDGAVADGAKTVVGELKERIGNEWVPVKNIEMKLSVKRLLGNLSVGEADTYTSDSTGVANAQFKRDSLPGDGKGNITLVARVEENETYGNLVTEKSVAWGTATAPPKDFFHQRTLWSTRFETPLWLLFTAYFIVIAVWGTLIYLVFQVIKIKKMGRPTP